MAEQDFFAKGILNLPPEKRQVFYGPKAQAYQVPILGMDAQGSWTGFGSPR